MPCSHLNEAMEGVLSSPAMGGVARMHTLARHKDILTEFAQEFRRTKASITSSLHHSELLGLGGSGKAGGNAFLSGEVRPPPRRAPLAATASSSQLRTLCCHAIAFCGASLLTPEVLPCEG